MSAHPASRRRASIAIVAVCSTLLASPFGVQAQAYPQSPVRFVVPMAPGGSVDTVSRSVANALSKRIGQNVIVDNKPGAGGSIAAALVAHAKPDGYTVFVADTGQLAINPSLYKSLPYDTSMGFVPVIDAVTAPLYLAVNAALPVRSTAELLAYAKASKVPLAYGSVGVGSVHHLGMELLAAKGGFSANHIPFAGAAQVALALASGELQMALSAMPSLKPLLAAGKIRLLAVATDTRVLLTPEVPTVKEGGIADFSVSVNVGFVLPPNTPAAVAETLYRHISATLNEPDVQTQLTTMGLVLRKSTPREYAQSIETETAKYRDVITRTGASAK